MKKIFFFIFSTFLTIQTECQVYQNDTAVDTYHGYELSDPYRYMENINNPEVINWFKTKSELTDSLLNSIAKRKYFIEKQKEHDDNKQFEYSNIVRTRENNFFYLKKTPSEKTSKLYLKNKVNGEETLLFDSEKYENYIGFSITYFKPSWNEKKVLISLTKDGNEFSNMLILDVDNKILFPEIINHCSPTSIGSVEWLPDSSGFIYSRFITTDTSKDAFLNTESVLHKVGTKSDSYQVLFSKNNNIDIPIRSEDFPIIYVDNPKNKYSISIVAGATPYFDAYYVLSEKLNTDNPIWKPLFKISDKVSDFIQVNNDIVYMTAKNATNFKICSTPFLKPNFKNPKVLVDEFKEEVIKELGVTKNGLFFTTLKNGVEAKLYQVKNNKPVEIKIPKPSGSISIETKGVHSEYLNISIQGWITEKSTYIYDFEKNDFIEESVFESNGEENFDDLVVEEVLVKSHDGEEVPLSLIYKKGLKRNGNNPVLMRGYGAYGVSMRPNPYYGFLIWAREGGIYAVAHVRGGGEKGDKWYKGGFKDTKPNTWKDFIACTEYLIDNKYTSNKKMSIWSGSAGGILIGRSMIERPDLFSAVILDRGILNPIRQENSPNGANNTKEFGTVKDPKEFIGLLEMDSYHQLKSGVNYPSTMIITGMNDKRIAPWQSSKFAAKMMKTNRSNNPILFKAFFDSGHGIKFVNKSEEYERMADVFTFALWRSGELGYQ